MRLYRIGALWRGTEADAKAAARETGLDWRKVEVPTDKPGLLAFLNQPEEGKGDEPDIAAVPSAPERPGTCPVCDRTEGAAARIAESEDLTALSDFILERAKPWQIEQLFSALGVRFHDLRKAAEAAR